MGFRSILSLYTLLLAHPFSLQVNFPDPALELSTKVQFENTHNKLMAACGVILGPLYGTLQSIIGGLTLVLLISVAGSFRLGFQVAKQTALPLARFLAVGGIAAFFFRIKAIFHFLLRRIHMNSVSNLLHLAQQGDKEAEAKLIIRYEPVIINTLNKMEPLMKIANNS